MIIHLFHDQPGCRGCRGLAIVVAAGLPFAANIFCLKLISKQLWMSPKILSLKVNAAPIINWYPFEGQTFLEASVVMSKLTNSPSKTSALLDTEITRRLRPWSTPLFSQSDPSTPVNGTCSLLLSGHLALPHCPNPQPLIPRDFYRSNRNSDFIIA